MLRYAPVLDAAIVLLVLVRFRRHLPPRLVEALETEVAILVACATLWRVPPRGPRSFSVHRDWPLYVGVIVFLAVVEGIALHLVLVRFVSTTAAWIANGLSLYGMLWLVGDALALRAGGITLRDDGLELAFGLRWRGAIPYSAIATIEHGPAPEGAHDVAVLGANVVVSLREPVTLRGMFARRRTSRVIALSVDDVGAFLHAAHSMTANAPSSVPTSKLSRNLP